MNLPRDKSIDKLSERLDNLYPDPDDKEGLGIIHWKGKPIIPIKEWRKLSISDSLHFFPDGLVVIALLPEGHSVDEYDESIFPYHDGDGIPRPGTEERKWSLETLESKLSAADRKLWQTRVREAKAKAMKEDPSEIWVQEYKELLAFKEIELPKHDGPKIV